MRQIHRVLGLIALACAAPLRAADPGPATTTATTSPADSYELLAHDFDRAEDALSPAFQAAKSSAERDAVRAQYDAILRQYTQRMFDLSVAQAGKSDARDALVWVLNNNDDVGVVDSALKELLSYARDLCAAESGLQDNPSPHAERLLQAIAEQSLSPMCRGRALLNLGTCLIAQINAGAAGETPASEEARAALARRAEDALQRAKRDYGAVEDMRLSDPKATIGSSADATLFELNHLTVGSEAPEIAGKDMNGHPLTLSAQRGKVVVLSFFGDWCAVCKSLFPEERALVAAMKDEPFVMLGVVSDEDPALIRERMTAGEVTWNAWFDGGTDGPIDKTWNIKGWPTVYVIDAKGIIRHKDVYGAKLETVVKRLIAETKPH
jgi:peroxiredoxin